MESDWDVRTRCSEAIQHGPADALGRCPWCGTKYTSKRARPDWGNAPSDLMMAYATHYDPDLPGLEPAALRRRYGYRESGQW